MKDNKILIYGGTTEGRELAESLCHAGFFCTVCVATEYGEQVMEALPRLTVCCGRMSQETMQEFTQEEDYLAVVDATHPFATQVSKNIKKSLTGLSVPYFRLIRDTKGEFSDGNIRWFSDYEACANALEEIRGNILLTTGSKELSVFCRKGVKERLFVRVLPGQESIALCEKEGIRGRQVIAMQGPFLTEMNEAVIRQYDISCLVTKESGKTGGFFEKIEAAERTGTAVCIIGNPEKEAGGYDRNSILKKLCELAGEMGEKRWQSLELEMHISIIGMGMGNPKHLTLEAKAALECAEVVFGAKRLLSKVQGERERHAYYLPEDILPKLCEIRENLCSKQVSESFGVKKTLNIAVLFSGDTGFYSGMENFYLELEQKKQNLECKVKTEIFPGISSISYLAAKVGMSWSDAQVVSIHGRNADIRKNVMEHKKTFVLVSDAGDMRRIGAALCGLKHVTVLVGYQLSYPQEEITRRTPAECMKLEREGLYCCFIENREAATGCLVTHGRKDECFIRGKVPMTKEEVREISICKLQLTKEAVFYDIGSGTGSIAVEAALLSENIKVYAIEQKSEAVELIQKNCAAFQLENVSIVETKAPAGLYELPVPTHAFIGGSGGNIREILQVLYQKNPKIRIVLNAVTLETAGYMTKLLTEFPIAWEEMIQVQVSRARKTGAYHLMQAENPVTIFSFQFRQKNDSNEMREKCRYQES